MLIYKILIAMFALVGALLIAHGAHVSTNSTSDGDLGEILLYGIAGLVMLAIAAAMLIGWFVYWLWGR